MLKNQFAYIAALAGLMGMASPATYAGQTTGAIFTTTLTGAVVNENHFNSKCAAYLDGGPGPNAPAHAAGLADGDYYFQVTDPSGKNLLSTDVVANRKFHVSNGVITSYTGVGGPTHPTGVDQDHSELGAITIRLANTTCPSDFLNTPNNGGVYKVWATPVEDFVGDPSLVDNACGGGCFHGFVPRNSKTDNFKVSGQTPAFCLTVEKQFVQPDGSLAPREGWLFDVTEPLGIMNSYFTDAAGQVRVCGLPEGSYTVREDLTPFPTVFVAGLIVNGWALPPDSVYSFTWSPGQPEPVIVFQNIEEDGGVPQ